MEQSPELKIERKPFPETIAGHLSTVVFQDIQEKTKDRVITVMGVQGIPESIVKGEFLFRSFFEREFFTLDEAGIQKFSELIRLARESFWGAFGGESKRFECSKAVNDVIEKGFASFEDVHKFFKLVSVEDNEGWEKFLNANLNTQKGHNRLSACKILKRALALYVIGKPLLSLKEKISGIFSTDESAYKNPSDGFLKGLMPKPENFIENIKSKPEILSDFIKSGGTIEILGKGKFVLNFEDRPVGGLSRIVLSLKDPEVAIEKLERKPNLGQADINDLFRMKFIFEDENSEEAIGDFLFHLHEYSNRKEFLRAKNKQKEKDGIVETRNKNFLPEDIVLNLIDIFGKEKIISHKNGNSGASYRAVNNKIDFGDGFAFEIQAVTELGNIINENPNTASGHFAVELRRFADHVARLEGKMTKEELLVVCDKFLKKYKERKLRTICRLLDYYKPLCEKKKKRVHLKNISPKMKELIDGYHGIEMSSKKHPEILYPKKVFGDFNVQPGMSSDDIKSKIKVTKNGFEMLFRNQRDVSKGQLLFDYLCLTGKISNVHSHYPQKNGDFRSSKYFIGTDLKKCHEDLFEVLEENKKKNKESKTAKVLSS